MPKVVVHHTHATRGAETARALSIEAVRQAEPAKAESACEIDRGRIANLKRGRGVPKVARGSSCAARVQRRAMFRAK
jgi:hypothetical protein